MPKTRLTLVHTSDVHLESDTFGRGEEGRAYQSRIESAFSSVVDLVISIKADLFLIAGDLFDSNRVPESGVAFVNGELRRLSCPTVVIPGNHDCYDHRSIYKKVDFTEVGPHVHTLTAEEGATVPFPELGATVWGKGMVEHDPAFRPLEGVPNRNADWWHIGMAHGYFAEEEETQRSSPVKPEEIESSGLDYLAMGHVHVFNDLSQGVTKSCYPGTPAPLYMGVDRGGSVAVVTLDPSCGVSLVKQEIAL